MLEDASGGGLAQGCIAGRALSEETALAWICTSRVISLQNQAA